MRSIRIIGRSITSGVKSVFRNFSLSMASITCTVITLILVAIGILLSYNVNNITDQIKDELTIIVFIDKELETEDLDAVYKEMNEVSNIESIEFVSKASRLEECLKTGSAMAVSCEMFGEEIFRYSYIVQVSEIKDIRETATTLRNLDKVDEIIYGESTINDLIRIFDVVRYATIGLVAALVLVTTFLISNTIKITIYSRRNEIEIMRLVGTGNTVIRMPFLVEGFILGALGSILPILLTIFGYGYAYQALNATRFNNMLGVINLINPKEIVYITSLALFIIGSIVGMFGSVRAVRKFLKI